MLVMNNTDKMEYKLNKKDIAIMVLNKDIICLRCFKKLKSKDINEHLVKHSSEQEKTRVVCYKNNCKNRNLLAYRGDSGVFISDLDNPVIEKPYYPYFHMELENIPGNEITDENIINAVDKICKDKGIW